MKTILGTLLILMIAGSAFARPPTAILLSYDKGVKTLHIDIKHISDSLREHHIRRVIVSRNDEEVQTLSFNTQKPPGLETDVVVEANPGDTFLVKAICSEAGNREELLTVPEDIPAEKTDNVPVEKPADVPLETSSEK